MVNHSTSFSSLRDPRHSLLNAIRGCHAALGHQAWKHVRSSFLLGLLFMTLSQCPGFVATTHADEPRITSSDTEVKAAYIFNFTKFIQWPESAFANASSPFVVGIVGKDSLGKTLERALLNEKVRNRPVLLKSVSDPGEMKQCHLLLISPGEGPKLESILTTVSKSPVLTISEQSGFCAQGGCVNFIAEGKAVRFEMNPSAMKQQGLDAHSRLLKLAKIVER